MNDVSQETVSRLSELDGAINQLSTRPDFDPNRLRDIQNERSEIDRRITSFKLDQDRRGESFNSSVQSTIGRLLERVRSI